MTALNWVLTEDLVVVVSDTLVVSADSRRPLYIGSKFFPIAHARTVIAGTGVAQCISRAAFVVTTQSVCRHVLDVIRGMTEVLIKSNEDVPTGMTSTAYVFGWDEDEERMRGFAFRSTNGFLVEELAVGLGIKPSVPVESGSIEPFEPFFIELVARQRRCDEAKPINDRVHIGGEIVMASLSRDALTLRTIYQFDDYAEAFNEAAASIRQGLLDSPAALPQ